MSSENEVFNKFVEIVSSIVQRPAMYGVSNVEGINLFILGYVWGSSSDQETIVFDFNNEFRDFINKEHAEDFANQTDHDWPRLIRFYSGGDLHSIELFGRWFDTFVTSFKKNRQFI